jgi:hypothetical protein
MIRRLMSASESDSIDRFRRRGEVGILLGSLAVLLFDALVSERLGLEQVRQAQVPRSMR